MNLKFNIGTILNEDCLPLCREYKKFPIAGTGINGNLQKAIDSGYVIVGHDANYVFLLTLEDYNRYVDFK